MTACSYFSLFLPLNVECDPSQGFCEEKLIQTQIGTTRDIFLKREGTT